MPGIGKVCIWVPLGTHQKSAPFGVGFECFVQLLGKSTLLRPAPNISEWMCIRKASAAGERASSAISCQIANRRHVSIASHQYQRPRVGFACPAEQRQRDRFGDARHRKLEKSRIEMFSYGGNIRNSEWAIDFSVSRELIFGYLADPELCFFHDVPDAPRCAPRAGAACLCPAALCL